MAPVGALTASQWMIMILHSQEHEITERETPNGGGPPNSAL